MGNPIDAMGRCIVCGKRCESTGGCDCLLIESQARPVGEVMAVVPDAELAALKQKLDQAENRERLALTEIKTLKDEKAALEARIALAAEIADAAEVCRVQGGAWEHLDALLAKWKEAGDD